MREPRPRGCGRRWGCGVVRRWRISRTSRSRRRRSRGWRSHGWPRSRSGSTRIWRSASTHGWSASSRRSFASIRCASGFVGQLMLALYRSGRQADALEGYRIARRRLVDELGLEPGRELQELERAILAQDPALEAPAAQTPSRAARDRSSRVGAAGSLIAAGGSGPAGRDHRRSGEAGGLGASTVRVGAQLAGRDRRPQRPRRRRWSRWVLDPARSRSVRGRCGWPTSTIRPSRASIPATPAHAARRSRSGALRRVSRRAADGVWVVESNSSPDLNFDEQRVRRPDRPRVRRAQRRACGSAMSSRAGRERSRRKATRSGSHRPRAC